MSLKQYLPLWWLLALAAPSYSQEFKKPSEYLLFVKNAHRQMFADVVHYAAKIETASDFKHQETHRRTALQKLKAGPSMFKTSLGYQSDKSLQDSLLAYSKRTISLLENDLLLVQRLQDSTLRSHVHAKRYHAAKQKGMQALLKGEDQFLLEMERFSAKYAVPMPKKADQEYLHLLATQQAGHHYTQLKLLFHKCKSQESLLAKAVDMRRKADIEQHSKQLLAYVKEAKAQLDTMQAYKQDQTLHHATRKALKFYQDECEKKVPSLLMFLTRGGEDQVKAKTDIGNNVKVNPHVHVEDPNLVANYGNTQYDLAVERAEHLDHWETTSEAFIEKHYPSL